MEKEELKESGICMIENQSKKHKIQLITVIGEIEGHENLNGSAKTTKYEHILPLLGKIEDSDEVAPNHGVLMTVKCGRGTYIRSICDDLGKLTGCPAHMRFLLRSQSGVFTLETAMTLEEAQAYRDEGTLTAHLLPLDWPIQHIRRIDVPDYLAKQVQNGVRLPIAKVHHARDVAEGGVVRIYLNDEFWGMAERQEDMLVWKCQLPPDKPSAGKEAAHENPA